MLELPPRRPKQKIPCPVCKLASCYDHCNHCGKNIYFKKNEYGRWCCYDEGTDILHRCMKKGTKDGKYYNTSEDFNESDWKAEMRKYDYTQQHYMCIECSRPYNRLVYPKCPSCWKMQCRSCNNKQSWRADKPLNQCYNCKHDKLDPVHVWSAYDRLYGVRNFN